MSAIARPEILTDIEVRWILDHQPACEGDAHPAQRWGHRLDQSAVWLVGAPCGITWFSCDGWARFIGTQSHFHCKCDYIHEMSSVAFIPIGGDHA